MSVRQAANIPALVTIGANVSGGTLGSVLFVGTGPVLAQDNANFFWDDTNNRLGINVTPLYTFHALDTNTTNASRAAYFVKTGTVTGTTYGNVTANQSIASTAAYGFYGYADGAGATNVGALFYATGATNNYGLIVAAGDVGMGTQTPVHTANYTTLSLSSTTGGQIVFRDDDVSKGFIYNNATDFIFSSVTGGAFIFYGETGTTERFRITSAGLVGIGTSGPENALDINSATGANLQLTYNDSNGSATNKVNFAVSSSGDLTITPSGGDATFTGTLAATTRAAIGTTVHATRPLSVLGTDLSVFERTTASTNGTTALFSAMATSTGDMVDGFASAFVFLIKDTAAVENPIAFFSAARAGADNTGTFTFGTYLAGTPANRMVVGATSVTPGSDDGQALGTTALRWADLFLAEGGVINWDAGDITLTQSGNTLTLDGGDLFLTSNKIIGGSTTTSDLFLQTTSGVGTTGADMHFLVGNNGATEAMTILNSGLVGINTNAPAVALDVIGAVGLQIRASDTTADATQKNFYLTARHYTNSEESVCIFITADATSVNVLGLGGGSSSLNGMTAVRVITTATNTTLTGTTALNVDVNGFTAMGKGTTAGTTILDLLGADNSTVLTIRINATQANVTAADTFVDFRSTSGSEGSIAGTAVAGVIAYNTFTGSHYTQIDDKTGIQVGMLLEMIDGDCVWPAVDKNVTQTTIIGDDEINEVNSGKKRTVSKQVNVKESPVEKSHLPKSRICQARASKAAYGAYGGTDMLERDLCLSLGAGVLFVANKGMDIEIGDYLMSSDVFGCAELQVLKDGSVDGIYRNITVAKSTQNVVWNAGEESRIVNVIYEGG